MDRNPKNKGRGSARRARHVPRLQGRSKTHKDSRPVRTKHPDQITCFFAMPSFLVRNDVARHTKLRDCLVTATQFHSYALSAIQMITKIDCESSKATRIYSM